MLEEARGAESIRNFISKTSIGLKEARETHVRLRIVERRILAVKGSVSSLVREAHEIVAVLTTIVRNTKRNARSRKAHAAQAGRTRSRIPNS
jgi:four helix bundle protein